MNAENFAEIIKNPAQLYQVSFHELKTLVLQYPFCRNLHYLLLQKSRMEQNRDFERVLEKTAACSVDRRHLYHLLHTMQTSSEMVESFGLEEDYLELQDLNELGAVKEKIRLPAEGMPDEGSIKASPGGQERPSPPTPASGVDGEDEMDFSGISQPLAGKMHDALPTANKERLPDLPSEGPPSGGSHPEQPPLSSPDLQRIAEDVGAWLGISEKLWEDGQSPTLQDRPGTATPARESEAPKIAAEAKTTAQPLPKPLPKQRFSSWSKSFYPAHLRPPLDTPLAGAEDAGKRDSGKKKKKSREDEVVLFAKQSLKENEEVASETLAELLTSQERYQRAIQMYERLILIFPEKSAFFAEKIQQLKKYL